MKKIFLAITMFLVALLVFAQTGTDKTMATFTTDTITVTTMSDDSVQALIESVVDNTIRKAEMVTVDDDDYILNNGYAYRLYDLDNLIDSVNESNDNVFNDTKDESQVHALIAICFIVPCVTIIIALIILLLFFIKKTQARNEIIGKAIDANYQLPDAFFSNQSASSSFQNSPNSYDSTSQNGPAPTRRDPKTFSSAMTLLSVGLALILFFAAQGWSIALIAGGIPFFLGVGKLIGYYYVPGFSSNNYRPDFRQHSSQPRYNEYQNAGYKAPSTPQQTPGAYPPPIKPNHNDQPDTTH